MKTTNYGNYESGLKEECGVFGIYDPDGEDVSASIYYGLSALQHRGQESCGIAVSDTSGPKGQVNFYKGMGLVQEVFRESRLEKLKGNIGIGHVRYSTTGATTLENAQPLVLKYLKGSLALAHNGNLVNAMELREEMEYTGAIFHTTIDSEIIAYHIARGTGTFRNGRGGDPQDCGKNPRCLRTRHHESEKTDRRAGPLRIETALHRQKRKRLDFRIGKLCALLHRRGICPRCGTGRDRDGGSERTTPVRVYAGQRYESPLYF